MSVYYTLLLSMMNPFNQLPFTVGISSPASCWTDGRNLGFENKNGTPLANSSAIRSYHGAVISTTVYRLGRQDGLNALAWTCHLVHGG
jgi:hypothetical protein